MAIHETKKQADLEKRLRLLRQQVYGKSEPRNIRISKYQTSNTPTHQHTDMPKSDITYLYQDLSKISILASMAIGIQIVLFILMKNHIPNLNFF